ncbi:hypothetical protein AB205_0095450, partial [Aquarana catesbeiana]
EKEIMKEIYENGPVQAIMEVHEDFFVYKSGIYRHTPVMAGEPELYRRHGTHSVKITGLGCLFSLKRSSTQKWNFHFLDPPPPGVTFGTFRGEEGADTCLIQITVVIVVTYATSGAYSVLPRCLLGDKQVPEQSRDLRGRASRLAYVH